MYEYAKVEEARYFLDKIQNAQTENDFLFNFSALLNAARSVVQYALEEHNLTPKTKKLRVEPAFDAWYKAHLNAELLLLRDIRDENIHLRPTAPKTVTARTDMVMHVTFRRPEPSAQAPFTTPTVPTSTTVVGATIDVKRLAPTWPHSEDIVEVAKRIVAAVEAFVTDGVRDGVLLNPDG